MDHANCPVAGNATVWALVLIGIAAMIGWLLLALYLAAVTID